MTEENYEVLPSSKFKTAYSEDFVLTLVKGNFKISASRKLENGLLGTLFIFTMVEENLEKLASGMLQNGSRGVLREMDFRDICLSLMIFSVEHHTTTN